VEAREGAAEAMTEGLSRRGFDIDLRDGEEREDAFAKVMKHEKVEHKRDYGAISSGNVYVEYEQLCSDGVWRPSGLATTDAAYWAFEVTESRWVVVATEELKAITRNVAMREPSRKCHGGDFNKTKGVKVPLAALVPTGSSLFRKRW